MRYLKTYKLFEMIVEEGDLPYFDDIKDRLLELEDDNYTTTISQITDKTLNFGTEKFIHNGDINYFTYGEPKEMIEITITKSGNNIRRVHTFNIDSIKDVLEPTIDMLGKYGFRFDSYYVADYKDKNKPHNVILPGDGHGYYKDPNDMKNISLIKLILYLVKDDTKSVDESKDWDKKFTCSIFDLSKELRDEVSDVLLELKDLNYDVTFEPFADVDTCPSVDILYKQGSSKEEASKFEDEVKEVISRIEQISKDYGWSIDTYEYPFGTQIMFIR